MPRKTRRTTLAQLRKVLAKDPGSLSQVKEPIRVSIRGRDAVVIVDAQEYDRLRAREDREIDAAVRRGEREAELGLGRPWKEVRKDFVDGVPLIKSKRRRSA
ncbi:MAG: type II toxin-antitoxin system prevent-host-death family antitoxin [Phycisphaerales bacterium]|nr:type II toxin-antitoxin system prevent-host-death family antitoxin [Phycisphaerales bacterium]